ncbi:hypothetical protein HN695_01420 [Candidatus Woesearchaeota archaeon]|jgi:hypothetical protein|nr:hypothetical protein [Candidatus Woesearchaeota archaeon]MBT5273060.1 hypothetical protein [Candidatus Woesearchaeota archaeon]MBT6040804.1 hypothetical protein [Candidatus Woesearchaeota archaeon]MBT6337625.1 hypothetical protein [Candidatus Woesearchaeota archaeon]MBT7926974.1 hypothetical protein [Candidatus Woesearchaeota archaeon]
MLTKSITLKHYKRLDIQQAMLASSQNREVATRFGDGFGKRPDTLSYTNEIIELAKQGATSFHVSEEHWNNVVALRPELSKKDLDELRSGWDLVLDIDCKYWYYSKLITKLLIDQLKSHGITSITVKFSGSKGFHIGVPFEAFPKTLPLQGKPTETRLLFPEAPKRIALYLKDKIEPLLLKEITKDKSNQQIAEMLNVDEKELFKTFCKACGAEPREIKTKVYFICPSCQAKAEADSKYKQCENCKEFMEKIKPHESRRCYRCSSKEFEEKFNSSLVLDIDTLLISSRHMYRMPFSLHEKSALCSVVIDPETVMDFEKEHATPSTVIPNLQFLDITNTKEGEASRIIVEAFDYKPMIEQEKIKLNKEYEVPEEAIPMSMFPPCLIKGLNGVDDGRKRFLFALLNFLECCGYNHETIDQIVREWNTKNPDPLKEVIINSQLRYRKQQRKETILPPNCMQAYQEINLCSPDGLCRKIKNPVQYAKTKSFIANKEANKGKRDPLTEEQKEMRRKHRAKKKEMEKNKNPIAETESNKKDEDVSKKKSNIKTDIDNDKKNKDETKEQVVESNK